MVSIVAHEPAGVGPVVAVGTPPRINHVIEQQQPGTFLVLFGVEDYISTLAVVACARKFGGDVDWAAELLGSGRDVERVQPLMIIVTESRLMATTYMVPFGPEDMSIAGVEVIPILGVTCPQLRLSDATSSASKAVTCQSGLPLSASKA